MKLWIALGLLLTLQSGAQMITPATEDMRKNLIEAVQAATLESSDTPAFHLEAAFDTFAYDGTPDGIGTLVEDYLKPGTQRRVLTFRGVARTQVSQGGSVHTSGASFNSTFMVRRLIPALLSPGPSLKRMQEGIPSYRTHTVGNVELGCVILAPLDVLEKDTPAEKLPSAYCMSANHG